MSEKEIDLNSVDTDPVDPVAPQENAEVARKARLRFQASTNKLQTQSSLSSAELVDFIANTPSEQLIPWEKVTLPSQGRYYSDRLPDGKIEVLPMTIKADKILATSRLTGSGQALDYIMDNHVRFPNGFSSTDLIIGDWTFLLYYLRGISYGNIYEFTVKCTNEDCARDSVHEYDLNELADTLKGPSKNEPFEVDLPYFSEITGRRVYVAVRFMRWRDVREITKRTKAISASMPKQARTAHKGPRPFAKQKAPVVLNETIEQNLDLAIVSINGDDDRGKIAQIVRKMHARDTSVIRQAMDDNMPGIDTDIEVTCPHCDEDMKMGLPFTTDFFRTPKSRGMREGI